MADRNRCQVRQSGSGPPLMLLHGWAANSDVFAPLMPWLTPRYTVYQVDLPGHGRAPAGALQPLSAVVDDLQQRVPPAACIAWSMSTLFALELAARDRLQGPLVVIAGTPCFARRVDWKHGMSPELLTQFAEQLASDTDAVIRRFVALETLGSKTAAAERQMLQQTLLNYPAHPQALRDGLSLLGQTDARAAVAGLAIPSLWLAGRRDRIVTPAAMQAAAALNPRAQYAEIPGTGHAPFIGDPQATVAAIESLV